MSVINFCVFGSNCQIPGSRRLLLQFSEREGIVPIASPSADRREVPKLAGQEQPCARNVVRSNPGLPPSAPNPRFRGLQHGDEEEVFERPCGRRRQQSHRRRVEESVAGYA